MQPEVGRLGSALLVVAKVGRNDCISRRDEQVAGGPGEAAQVATVLRVGDERAIELMLLERCAKARYACLHCDLANLCSALHSEHLTYQLQSFRPACHSQY